MKARKSKKKELHGFLQSGYLFIGDPSFMRGDLAQEDVIAEDPSNPFKDWDNVSDLLGDESNIDMPGSVNGDLPGRGVAIQTHKISGRYVVKKSIDKKTCSIVLE